MRTPNKRGGTLFTMWSFLVAGCLLGTMTTSCRGQLPSTAATKPMDETEYRAQMRKAADIPDKQERQRAQMAIMLKRIEDENERRSRTTTILKGEVVDEQGQRLNGVTFTITKYRPWKMGPDNRPQAPPQTETRVVNETFDLQFEGFSQIGCDIEKKGYYSESVGATDGPSNRRFLERKIRQGVVVPAPDKNVGIRIVLEKQGMLTHLMEYVFLDYSAKKEAQIIDLSRNPLKAHGSERPTVLKLTDKNDIPRNAVALLAAIDDKDGLLAVTSYKENGLTKEAPKELRVYLNAPEGGILIYEPKNELRGWREMKEAPTDGYTQELILDPKTFPMLSSGKAEYEGKSLFFYFKTADGKYGKGRINSIRLARDRTTVGLGIGFAMQPDGSRNLETADQTSTLR